MTNDSQREIIIGKLLKDGFVSRNWCLRGYISRLSAIIFNLKEEGWDFTGEFVKENGGKNYYYTAIKCPSPYSLPTPQLFEIKKD